MNLIEAIKSGKRYKRVHEDFWHNADDKPIFSFSDVVTGGSVSKSPSFIWDSKNNCGLFLMDNGETLVHIIDGKIASIENNPNPYKELPYFLIAPKENA